MEFPKVLKKEAIMEYQNIHDIEVEIRIEKSYSFAGQFGQRLFVTPNIQTRVPRTFKSPTMEKWKELTWNKPDFPGLNPSIEMEFAITSKIPNSSSVSYTDWHVEISWTLYLRTYLTLFDRFQIFQYVLRVVLNSIAVGHLSGAGDSVSRETISGGRFCSGWYVKVMKTIGWIDRLKHFSSGSRMLSLVLHQKRWAKVKLKVILLQKHC